MRVLLDEQLPRQLASAFVGHDVRTVQQQGWAGLKNGELLRRAGAAGFDVFVTADQNLEFQQNLERTPLFVLVMAAPSNTLEDLLPVVPAALEEMTKGQPGHLVRVSAPNPASFGPAAQIQSR